MIVKILLVMTLTVGAQQIGSIQGSSPKIQPTYNPQPSIIIPGTSTIYEDGSVDIQPAAGYQALNWRLR